MNAPKNHQSLNAGYDTGNYASAYISPELFEAWRNQQRDLPEGPDPQWPYDAGFILGFFSSYEEHEIPSEAVSLYRLALQVWRAEVRALGWFD